MAQKFIDLSGRKGLASRFQGNLNDTSSVPQRIYLAEDGQIADGIFNPLKNYGYLSPANNKYLAITGAINSRIISTEYDSINDDVYMAENGTSIWHLDGLSDTSLTLDRALSNSTAILNDLQLYEVNGVRKLFYVYTKMPIVTLTTTLSSSVNWLMSGTFIKSSASVVPTLSTSVRGTSASGTTVTVSIVVNSGSDRLLYVIAQNYTGTAATSATFDGVSMTLDTTGTTGTKSVTTFYIIAPTVTTANVVVTWSSSQTNQVINAFVFQGVNQTSPTTGLNSSSSTSNSAVSSVIQSNKYILAISMTISNTATHTQATDQTEVFNSTNTVGNDSTSYKTFSFAVDVGIASLPFASADDSWLTATVSGAFTLQVTTNNNFITIADNGFAYLFSENHVHKIDGATTGGTNGTVTKDVLLFPSYFKTVDAVDTRGKMYIAVQANPVSGDEDFNSYSESIVGVYVWDRASTIVSTRDFIPLYGVRDIKKLYIDPSGDVRAICIGDDRFVQIRSISSGYGKIIKTLGMSAYPENVDGLKVVNNMITWLGADGIFYLHGKLSPNDTEELYKFGNISAEVTGAFTTGAIFVGDTTGTTTSRQGIICSFTDTVGSDIIKWYPHGQGTISTVAQTGNQGDVYTPVIPLPAMSTVKNITINCFPTANAATTTIATVKIYFNQSTTAFKSHVVTQALASKGYVSIECNKPFVSSVQIEIEFSTTETLGTDDFNPMFALINFEPPASVVK